MELIKPIIRVGNSAGVLVPKSWLHGKARIELLATPLNVREDILHMLESYMPRIMALAIVGSYARNEQTERSDIDALALTENIDKNIKQMKYNVILVSKKTLEYALENNILPILPMLKEAKPMMNSPLIKNLSKTPLTKNNLKPHIELTKSAMRVVNEALKLAKIENKDKISDNIAYSLGLRMRQTYIVDCLIKKKQATNKELKRIITKIASSLKLYEAYLRAKDNKRTQTILPLEEAKKAHSYILNKIKEQEKWIEKSGKKG